MESMPLLRIKELQVTIGHGAEVLYPVDRVSLDIPRSSIVGLVGESGCGKSMTAMSIMQLLPRSASISGGSVCLGGEEISAYSAAKMREVDGDRISMIFQEPMTSLNPTVRVGKQVEEGLLLHTKLDRRERKARVIEMFQSIGIPDPADRYMEYPHRLSGGLRQRVMIAMAMINEPELLIADEPTTALDVTIEAQILKLMHKLRDDFGTSILMITHNLGIVSELCDTVNVMYLGEIVESAPTASLFDKPLHPYTRSLISCVPVITEESVTLTGISGQVPNLRSVPSGCRFNNRCPLADERCCAEHPPLIDVGECHSLRCFKASEVHNG